ncbi:MAG: zinc ribbon domain-containing protein [Thermodesulfobacteriota bacterium]
MPIYEFRCQECKTLFEAIVASCDAIKDVTCKKCNSARVEKTISASSFRIASSGSSIPAGALSGCSSKSGFS